MPLPAGEGLEVMEKGRPGGDVFPRLLIHDHMRRIGPPRPVIRVKRSPKRKSPFVPQITKCNPRRVVATIR